MSSARERHNAALGRPFGLTGPQVRLLAVLGAYGAVGTGESQVAAGLWDKPQQYRRAQEMLRDLHRRGFVELGPAGWRVTAAGRAPFVADPERAALEAHYHDVISERLRAAGAAIFALNDRSGDR